MVSVMSLMNFTLLVMVFIAPVVHGGDTFNVTNVEVCPTGIGREDIAKELCPKNQYHCIPDNTGNLFQFCTQKMTNVSISYYQLENGTFYWNKYTTVNFSTDTEFYSNISLQIINVSVGHIPNGIKPVFENYRSIIVQKKNEVPDTCEEDKTQHILPERYTCEVVKSCLKPQPTPWITIPVIKIPLSDGKGGLVEIPFKMPLSDFEEYAVLSLALCSQIKNEMCLESTKHRCVKPDMILNQDCKFITNFAFGFLASFCVIGVTIFLLFKIDVLQTGSNYGKCFASTHQLLTPKPTNNIDNAETKKPLNQ